MMVSASLHFPVPSRSLTSYSSLDDALMVGPAPTHRGPDAWMQAIQTGREVIPRCITSSPNGSKPHAVTQIRFTRNGGYPGWPIFEILGNGCNWDGPHKRAFPPHAPVTVTFVIMVSSGRWFACIPACSFSLLF